MPAKYTKNHENNIYSKTRDKATTLLNIRKILRKEVNIQPFTSTIIP